MIVSKGFVGRAIKDGEEDNLQILCSEFMSPAEALEFAVAIINEVNDNYFMSVVDKEK